METGHSQGQTIRICCTMLPTLSSLIFTNTLQTKNCGNVLKYLRICVCVCVHVCMFVPGSSVGIAKDYGLDGRGSNPGGARFFARPDRPWGTFCIMGTGSFPRVKCGRRVLLTTHTPLVPRSRKGRAIPLSTL